MRKLPGKECFLWDRAVTRTPEEQRLVRRGPLAFSVSRTQSRDFRTVYFFHARAICQDFCQKSTSQQRLLNKTGQPRLQIHKPLP